MKRGIELSPWKLITKTTKIDIYLDNYLTLLIENNGEYFFIVEEEQKIFDISQMPQYIKKDWLDYNKKCLSLLLINEQIKKLKIELDQFEEEINLLKSLRDDLITKNIL